MDTQPEQLSVPPTGNLLPAQSGPLIGRERDLTRVRGLLAREDVRLLTLIGPAGTGKTRLAVAAGGQAVEHFRDGVWFVDLSPVHDPALVASSTAQALGIREDRDRPLIETLKKELANRSALVILDNFEQVLAAGRDLASLLRVCPELKFLVTSRSALHVSWEHELRVSPLELPNLEKLPAPASLAEIASVALFVQRTNHVDPEFHLDEANARAVAEICVRLDGLPLAIELAAARTRVLPPHALLSRLGRRMNALGRGPLDQPARQQSLRAALDWSYDLLAPVDQALFRRLAVFVGGFSLPAVREIRDLSSDAGGDSLQAIESLLEKSLLRQIGEAFVDEPRFGMLETVREYAFEQLETSGELSEVRRQHATYYLSGADVVVKRISSAHQSGWLRSLDAEHDNIRAALDWCREAMEPELGLRAAGLLAWFWQVRGHISEGRARLTELLSIANTAPPALRAEGLRIVASLALSQGEDNVARAMFEESLAIRRELDDAAGLLGPLCGLGYAALRQGDDATAQACFTEALVIQRELDDKVGMAESLNSLANLAHGRGDLTTARGLYEQSLTINREVGYRMDVVEHNLGVVAQEQGDFGAARQYFESSVAARRTLGDTPGLALSLAKMGEVVAAQGDVPAAHRALAESVALQRDLGDLPGLAFALERMAIVAAQHGHSQRALRLAGACATLREQVGIPLNPWARASLDNLLAPAWKALKAHDAALVWKHGRGLSIEAAAVLALEPYDVELEPSQASHSEPAGAQLTAREREVAALVARGLTNRQIASDLVIADRTVDAHVSNILNKLSLTSRAQLAAWVVQHRIYDPTSGNG